ERLFDPAARPEVFDQRADRGGQRRLDLARWVGAIPVAVISAGRTPHPWSRQTVVTASIESSGRTLSPFACGIKSRSNPKVAKKYRRKSSEGNFTASMIWMIALSTSNSTILPPG